MNYFGAVRGDKLTSTMWLSWVPLNHKRCYGIATKPHPKMYLTKRAKEQKAVIQAVADSSHQGLWVDEELGASIAICRRTPLEKKSGHRNPRRGDPINSPQLVFDALEGIWYHDDEQITHIAIQEYRRCKRNLFAMAIWPTRCFPQVPPHLEAHVLADQCPPLTAVLLDRKGRGLAVRAGSPASRSIQPSSDE